MELDTPEPQRPSISIPVPPRPFDHEDVESLKKGQAAIQSLSTILVPGSILESLSSSKNPTFSLLTDDDVASRISSLLRQPDSGASDNHLCRWLYDTFQSSDPNLQLVVLRFLPIVAGVYMSRVPQRKPLAGFEAVLLALYSHETVVRNGAFVTVSLPDLSHSSIYHEKKSNVKSNATELNLAVVSPSLEPHGTVRSTRRARIVGVTLELFFSKISSMPKSSKMDFCEFCTIWAGQDGEMYRDSTETAVLQAEAENKAEEGRIPLQWELLVPVLRIIGHCLGKVDEGLQEAAFVACRSLYARAMHDVDARAISHILLTNSYNYRCICDGLAPRPFTLEHLPREEIKRQKQHNRA